MRWLLPRVAPFCCLVVLTPLVVSGPAGGSTLGVTSVTLACSDGTSLALRLDAAALTDLTDAVTAVNAYPAGDPPLACSLKTTLAVNVGSVRQLSSRARAAAGGENPTKDYAVGGGQFQLDVATPPIACDDVNFSLSAHVNTGARMAGVGGSFNLTVPEASNCPPGHLVAKVDCVAINATVTVADLTAKVTKSSGPLAGPFPPGSWIAVAVGEKSQASEADGLSLEPAGGPCRFGDTAPRDIDRGNIRIDGNQD